MTFRHTPKQARKLWVDELRSGEHKQCKRRMTDGVGHCCLHVAVLAFEKAEGREPERSYNGSYTLMDFPEVKNWLGLRHSSGYWPGCSLAEMNDDGKTFAEIADIIESEPEGLFVEEVSA